MNVKRLTVHAGTGSLRVIAVWKSLIEHHAHVCDCSMHVNASAGRESLSNDLVDCPADRLAIISAALSVGPMTVLMTGAEFTSRPS